jgi:hypothetical protein
VVIHCGVFYGDIESSMDLDHGMATRKFEQILTCCCLFFISSLRSLGTYLAEFFSKPRSWWMMFERVNSETS